MRRTVVVLGLVAGLLAGCQDGEPAGELAVTTPPPSATAGGPTGSTAPPPGTATPAPATTATAPADALTAYDALVADWQRSRSTFFTAVSDGTARPVAAQRALAAAHLAGLRRFAAGVRTASPAWPAPARTAARDLLAANTRQQATLAAMAQAPGAGAFTARLADYGVGVTAEERAIRTVRRALGG